MGEYVLENCSMYNHIQIKGKNIFVFDSHNMALPVWGTYSNRMQTRFNLVTFDSHADTRGPFTSEVMQECVDHCITPNHPIIKSILKGKKYKRKEFNFEDVFKIAHQHIENDEHIQTAYYFGYIKSYNVICRLDNFEAKSYEEDDICMGYDAKYYIREQVKEHILSFIDEPLILDFDLDYFISKECFNADFKQMIESIVKKATVITIAREPKYFDECKLDGEYSCETALNMLLETITSILDDKDC